MNDKEDIPSLVGRLSREHWEKVLVAPAVAAERERCAQVAFTLVAERDQKFACDVRAAISKGE